jgi:thiol-disulfide isomerase/thioredoxin
MTNDNISGDISIHGESKYGENIRLLSIFCLSNNKMLLNLTSEKDVNQKSLQKIDNALTQDTVWFNFANWCGHCNEFKEEWNKFKKLMSKEKVNVISVESTAMEKIKQHPRLYKRATKKEGNQQVLYFPMIIFFVKKGDKMVKKVYDGQRTADDLKKFLQANKPKPKPKPKAKAGGAQRNRQELEAYVSEVIENFFKLS